MSGFKGGDNTNVSQKKFGYLIALIIVLALVVIGWYFGTSDDGKFTEWSACDKNCGEGTQTRTYVPPIRNGKDLPDKNILTKLCNNKPCPISGKLSEWSTWGDCDKPCGSGIKTQTRTYTAPLYGGGDLTDKNVLINTQSCNTNPCIIDGKYNTWSNWGTCVKSKTNNSTINCGSGEQRRTRTYSQPMNGGNDDADYQGNDKSPLENKLLEWRDCTHDTIPNCPRNGTYSNWGGFGTCVKSETDNTAITCGTGKKSKTRTYNTPQYGGVDHEDYKGTTDLSRKLIEWEGCTHSTTPNCPVDGSYSNWDNDGLCAKSETDSTPINCGSGIQKRIKTYTQPQYNGLHATGYTPGNTDLANGLVNYEQVCQNTKICQPTNASCSNWVNDGNAICVEGQYQQKIKRTYTAAVDGGAELTNTPDNNLCKTSLVHEKYILAKSDPNIALSEGKCPANGIMSDFSASNINNCTPATGKDRSQYVVSTYTFPTSNSNTHDPEFTKIGFSQAQIKELTKSDTITPKELTYTINNIEYKITRTNTEFPYTYEIKKKVLCGSVYNFSTNEINNAWKESTGCSQGLNNSIYTNLSTTEDDLRYLDDLETNVKPKFNPFTKNTLIKDKNTDNIKLCYGSDNTTGYVTVDNINKGQYIAGTILPSGLKFTAKDITILQNDTHKLLIDAKGIFTLVKIAKIPPSTQLFAPSYTAVNFDSLIMQHDGNLVVYNNATTRTALWASGTGGNPGAYLELATNGSLMIKKSNVEIIKYLFIPEDKINTAWKDTTGCTQDLNTNILTNLSTSYSALSILNSIANVATKFNPFTKNTLIKDKNTDNIKLCYGSDNTTGYVTVDNTNKTQYSAGTILPSGLKFTAKDITILHNTTHKLLIDANGIFKFVKISPETQLLVPSYTAVDFGSLIMQHDGNLVVYSNATTRTALWASGTGGNPGAYLELATNGSLMIKKSNVEIIKYLFISEDKIITAWKEATGCTQELNTNIYSNINKTLNDLQILDNIEKSVKPNFEKYKLDKIIQDYTKIKQCYGDNGYITVDNTNKSQYIAGTILLPGIKFNKGMKDGLDILKNGKYSFSIDETGALYIDGPATYAFYTVGNISSLDMQHDGNLVIYDVNKAPLWSSGTGGNPGARLELEDTGSLYIKNANGVIIKYLRDRVGNHLTTSFWDNSPDAVFSDKKGRFFPFKWEDSAVMTNSLLDANKIPSDDCCGNWNPFRGWFRGDIDTPWNGFELDLLSIYSYIQKSNGAQPVKGDSNEYNYNSNGDRLNFYTDCCNPSTKNIRKPAQFTTGGSDKSNYLPGYDRISYVDGGGDKKEDSKFSYKFLIMDRGSSKQNQAFVVYKKIQDRTAFANDIINNHPELVNRLKDFYRNN